MIPRAKRWLGIALLTAVSTVATPARADGDASAQLEATIHLKVLTYDRKLLERSKGKLLIGVVYREDSEVSRNAKTRIMKALTSLGATATVQGLVPRAIAIPYESTTFERRLNETGPTFLYVTPGLEDALDTVEAASRARKAPTLSGRRSDVDRGLAIGVVIQDGKPRILVRLKAARDSGMDIDAAVLGLAEIIK